MLATLLSLLARGALIEAEPVATSLEGSQVALFEEAAESVLLVLFVAVECPISNRFAPSVNAIYEEFSAVDFAMWTIYTDDLFSTDEILKHRADFEYGMPALMDFDRGIAKHGGATVTPEAVVFVREVSGSYRMVYRGRIDHQYVGFGK